MMLFKKSPQGKTRLTYPRSGGADISRLVEKLAATPPQQAAKDIATAEIVDCVEQSGSPWFFGRYGFVLANVQPVRFLPCKGALGFFDWRKLNGMAAQ